MLTALTLAGAGSANRIRSLEDELSKRNPGNTILNDWLPISRRAAELDARHACSSAVGTCFCGRWWQGQGARGVSTLRHAVERGRPEHFHPHCCQVWVREAPLVPSRGRRFAPSVPTGNKRLTLFFPGEAAKNKPLPVDDSCIEVNVKREASHYLSLLCNQVGTGGNHPRPCPKTDLRYK